MTMIVHTENVSDTLLSMKFEGYRESSIEIINSLNEQIPISWINKRNRDFYGKRDLKRVNPFIQRHHS